MSDIMKCAKEVFEKAEKHKKLVGYINGKPFYKYE